MSADASQTLGIGNLEVFPLALKSLRLCLIPNQVFGSCEIVLRAVSVSPSESVVAMANSSFLLEVCVDSLHGALEAQRGGAGRLELCADLDVGGVTPSYGLMKLVKDRIRIPVHVLIRPRGGDFVYSELEIEVMEADIAAVGALGFHGVAIGALTPSREVDLLTMRALLRHCERFNLATTFHRAFDCVAEPLKALEVVTSLGISRILTSGQEAAAVAGVSLLRGLMEGSGGRVSIMPGAGVTDVNAGGIVKELGVTELHGSVRKELRVSSLRDLLPGDKNSVIWTVDAKKAERIVSVCKDALVDCAKRSRIEVNEEA